MPTFTEADKPFREALDRLSPALLESFASARAIQTIDLSGTDITQSVLLRLKAFLLLQNTIKTCLEKRYAAPAADFFVETVCFFLKAVLETHDDTLTVVSEKSISTLWGAKRPDISVWRGEELLAVIECKTQLGWKRKEWHTEFDNRETDIRGDFPDARIFLLVATSSNWRGFEGHERAGKQFFVLLEDVWPDKFDATSKIIHTVESLINEILKHTSTPRAMSQSG